MNPTLSQRIITRAYEKDPQAAAAEYGGEFRSDLANFLTSEAIDACVVARRYELPARGGQTYCAFCDPSGGSSDSMTLAIAHGENGATTLDLVREVVPPFSPEQVVKDFSVDAKRYGCYSVTGDRWGAEWVVEQFEKNGVAYAQSEKAKSDIYLSLLPAVNSRQVELLDNARLRNQLAGLERRTRSGGKDVVDHRSGLHDDVANAAAGALVLVAGGSEVYGLLAYDAQVVSGKHDTAQDFKLDAAANPRNNNLSRRADLKFAIAFHGVSAPPPPGLPPPAPTPPCPACGSLATGRVDVESFHCKQCTHQWGTVRVGGHFDRRNLPEGRT